MEMEITLPNEIAVMTLPDVTFFPQALLPLHIFEPRYQQMLKDALATDRLFAVAGLNAKLARNTGQFEPPHRIGTIGIVREPLIADWSELEVGKVEAEIPEGFVEHELDVLRSSVANLKPVEGRPVHADDTLVLDLESEQGESSHDYVVELGAGNLAAEIEQALIGAQIGESKTVPFTLADGKTAEVTVTVKEI